MLEFNCTHCRRTLKADPKYAGRRAKCKFCLQPVTVPAVVSPAETPRILSLDEQLDAMLAEPTPPEPPPFVEPPRATPRPEPISFELVAESLTPCPFCAEPIQPSAIKCRHCGEFLNGPRTSAPQQQVIVQNVIQGGGGFVENTGGALGGLLSFLWPGLGQMVQGRIGAGLLWMFGVFFGYMLLIVPGLVLHLVCIIDAARGVPQIRSQPRVGIVRRSDY